MTTSPAPARMSPTDPAAAVDGPAVVAVGGVLARVNPVTKLAVATVISVALLLTVDVVTAGVALLLELLAQPLTGLSWQAAARRTAVVAVGAVPAGVATAVFGVDSGHTLFGLGPVTVTSGSAVAGVAITLRVFAVGLPGVLLMATTDPTDLADALAQILRLPVRFVLSALAALRLFGVLVQEWEALRLARRARGLGDDGIFGRVTTSVGQIFALLVLTLRRATTLALAMEGRGFGATRHRTWARPSRLTMGDAVVLAGGIAVAAVATTAGVLAGTWDAILF
jgi:energy-coupling factor transport system permease protein